jgi:DNA integrity scanning protein DisA with diadenylate cyclase activity
VAPDVLETVLTLAVQIAREGREGQKVGTIFTVGNAEAVLAHSRPLILDPLRGHADDDKHVGATDTRETIKELALLDGGFVVTNEGVVQSAARYFDASSEGIELPLGLGSRHMAAAAITKHTQAVGVVVSESSVVRLFESGKIVSEIIPELWMLHRHGTEPFRESDAAKQSQADEGGPALVLENRPS